MKPVVDETGVMKQVSIVESVSTSIRITHMIVWYLRDVLHMYLVLFVELL